VEKLAAVVDAAQPRPSDKLISENLLPEGVDFAALGKKAVSADVETVSFVLIGPAYPTDHSGIGLKHDA
jgi:hypothetical protein